MTTLTSGSGNGVTVSDGLSCWVAQRLAGETGPPVVGPGTLRYEDPQEEVPSTKLQQYNACLCLYGKNGAVYSEWEALTNFLAKLHKIDNTIQVLPWQISTTQYHNPPIATSNIPQVF